jgi:hypothetical protein
MRLLERKGDGEYSLTNDLISNIPYFRIPGEVMARRSGTYREGDLDSLSEGRRFRAGTPRAHSYGYCSHLLVKLDKRICSIPAYLPHNSILSNNLLAAISV